MAKRPLAPFLRDIVERKVQEDPVAGKRMIAAMDTAGFDVSGIKMPEGGWTDEVAAFAAGIPEGATYGLADYGDTGSLATSYDVPVIGDVQPSREAGRLLGGVVTGGTLWRLGLGTLGNVGKRAAMGALKNMGVESAKTLGRAGKVGRVAGAATPEAIVGSVAEGNREGSWEAALSALPEWYALGVGSELGLSKLRSVWNKRKAGTLTQEDIDDAVSATKADIERSNQFDQANQMSSIPDQYRTRSTGDPGVITDEGYQQSIDRQISDDRPSPDKVIKKLSDANRPLKGEELALDIRPTANKTYYVSDAGDIMALESSNPEAAYLNQLDKEIRQASRRADARKGGNAELFKRQRDNLLATKRRAVSRSGPPNGDGFHRGMVVKYRDLMTNEKPVQIQGDEMLVDYNRLGKWYQDGVWKNAGLPESAFQTREEFFHFMQERAWLSQVLPFDDWKKVLGTAKTSGAIADDGGRNTKAVDLVKEYDVFLTKEARRRLVTRQPAVGAQEDPRIVRKPSATPTLSGIRQISAKEMYGVDPVDVRYTPEGVQASFPAKLNKQLGIREYDDAMVSGGDSVELVNAAGSVQRVTVINNTPEYWEVLTKNGNSRKYMKSVWTPQGMVKGVGGGSGVTPGTNVTASYDQRTRIRDLVLQLGRYSDKQLPIRMLPEDISFGQANNIISKLEEGIYLHGVREEDRFADIMDAIARGEPHTRSMDAPLDIEVQGALENMSIDELATSPGMLHKIVGPHSIFGIGKNKFVKNFLWDYTISEQELMQATQVRWLDTYAQVRKLVGLPERMTLKEIVGVKSARVAGKTSPYDEGKEKLFKIGRALDTDFNPQATKPDDWDEGMVQAYQLYRNMTDEVADHLGLPKQRRVQNYLHHIFDGKAGQYLAKQIAGHTAVFNSEQARYIKELGNTFSHMGENADDLLESIFSLSGNEVFPRGYRGLLERKGSSDYTYDLDAITMPMIFGSTQRSFSKKVTKRTHDILTNLPLLDVQGRPNPMPLAVAQFARHVTGRSSHARERIAQFWTDSKLFNRGVDRIIELVGGSPSAPGTMFKGRLRDAANKPLHPQEMEETVNWLDSLVRMSRDVDPKTGKLTKNASRDPMSYYRAKIALKAHDLRDALSNSSLSGPVSGAIYRTMIMAKLGINVAHGLTNLTQTIVNTWPLLKKGTTSRAVEDYLFQSNRKINGRSVKELIEESGISRDITSTEEFMGMLPSTWKNMQEKALVFSKTSEEFNRGVAFLGKYRDAIAGGSDHGKAMYDARMFVERTQFPFNRAGTPQFLRGPLMRLIFMFKSYPIHQTDFTATMIKNAWDGAKGKSFAEALNDDDVGALAKHITAYLSLIGGGMALMPESNFSERNMPPALDIAADFGSGIGRYGTFGSAANVAFGPAADTATHLGRGIENYLDYLASILGLSETLSQDALDRSTLNMGRFVGSLTPTLLRKALEEGSDASLLEMFSLKKYEPASSGRRAMLALPPMQDLTTNQINLYD